MNDSIPETSLSIKKYEAMRLKRQVSLLRLRNLVAVPLVSFFALTSLGAVFMLVWKMIQKGWFIPQGKALVWLPILAFSTCFAVLCSGWIRSFNGSARALELRSQRLLEGTQGDEPRPVSTIAPSEPTPWMLQEAERMNRAMWMTRVKRTGSAGVLVFSTLMMCGGGCSSTVAMSYIVNGQESWMYLLFSASMMLLGGAGIWALMKRMERYKEQGEEFSARRVHLVEGKIQPGALQISVPQEDGGALTLEPESATLELVEQSVDVLNVE